MLHFAGRLGELHFVSVTAALGRARLPCRVLANARDLDVSGSFPLYAASPGGETEPLCCRCFILLGLLEIVEEAAMMSI